MNLSSIVNLSSLQLPELPIEAKVGLLLVLGAVIVVVAANLRRMK